MESKIMRHPSAPAVEQDGANTVAKDDEGIEFEQESICACWRLPSEYGTKEPTLRPQLRVIKGSRFDQVEDEQP